MEIRESRELPQPATGDSSAPARAGIFARLWSWLWTPLVHPPLGAQCKNCDFFEDYSEVDPEEPCGYCCHPFHSTRKSEHYEYGGHWAYSDDVCPMWERKATGAESQPDAVAVDPIAEPQD